MGVNERKRGLADRQHGDDAHRRVGSPVGHVDGARVKNTARNISPNLLLSTRLNTGLLPVSAEDILHGGNDLAQGRTALGPPR